MTLPLATGAAALTTMANVHPQRMEHPSQGCSASTPPATRAPQPPPRRRLRRWRFAVLALLTVFAPATYSAAVRAALAQAVCRAAWRVLPGYALASLLLGAVLTQVVATTAASYGLSHLALEAMARVFVAELLPLAAALFVAAHTGLETMNRLAAARADGLAADAPALLHGGVVPAILGGAFGVALLTLVSAVLVLAVAYLVVYGFTPWALAAYRHLIGRVFDPVTASILAWKLSMFSVIAGLMPTLIVAETPRQAAAGGETRAMASLLFGLVVVETVALALYRL